MAVKGLIDNGDVPVLVFYVLVSYALVSYVLVF